eukprot:TRINITY_DN561_c1_g1_i1.p2 TRINITY_DN561_c1_g1~~TRINITY_DN561_c1_g1_i1.p2  ORF type:complete len:178 (+),score=42.36 TRINITY_DN561_c1_g1_i1:44-535(+)
MKKVITAVLILGVVFSVVAIEDEEAAEETEASEEVATGGKDLIFVLQTAEYENSGSEHGEFTMDVHFKHTKEVLSTVIERPVRETSMEIIFGNSPGDMKTVDFIEIHYDKEHPDEGWLIEYVKAVMPDYVFQKWRTGDELGYIFSAWIDKRPVFRHVKWGPDL